MIDIPHCCEMSKQLLTLSSKASRFIGINGSSFNIFQKWWSVLQNVEHGAALIFMTSFSTLRVNTILKQNNINQAVQFHQIKWFYFVLPAPLVDASQFYSLPFETGHAGHHLYHFSPIPFLTKNNNISLTWILEWKFTNDFTIKQSFTDQMSWSTVYCIWL